MSIQLSTIIVNRNTGDLLSRCLASLFDETRSLESEAIVVDNASSDGSFSNIENDFSGIQVISNKENLGFAWANNQAIARAKGEFVLLLNPDTLVKPGSLKAMINFMQRNPRAGIAGPKILNPDGTLQLSCHTGPSPASIFLTWIMPEILLERLCLINNKPCKAGYVSGACLLIRRRTIDDIGLLDEDFFMYSEDADWCLRARKKGWQVYFLPEAEIVHYGRASVKSYGLVAMSQVRAQSNYLLIKKHFGRFKAELFYIFISVFSSFRKFLWRICLVFSADKQKIKETISVYDALIKGIRLGRER